MNSINLLLSTCIRSVVSYTVDEHDSLHLKPRVKIFILVEFFPNLTVITTSIIITAVLALIRKIK